jgi:hypothetical protein
MKNGEQDQSPTRRLRDLSKKKTPLESGDWSNRASISTKQEILPKSEILPREGDYRSQEDSKIQAILNSNPTQDNLPNPQNNNHANIIGSQGGRQNL